MGIVSGWIEKMEDKQIEEARARLEEEVRLAGEMCRKCEHHREIPEADISYCDVQSDNGFRKCTKFNGRVSWGSDDLEIVV